MIVNSCDNCGKTGIRVIKGTQLTKCCSTYDQNSPLAFYRTKDSSGRLVYSSGKVIKTEVKFQFPFKIKWGGFFLITS
jgi:hypothetical protein